jgi:hypothetical protein
MQSQLPLTEEEREAITTAVKSVFAKLKKLHHEIAPIFQKFGFATPSAGVMARDLSEKIEAAIVQHCESFTKGEGHCDLARLEQQWEVKVCLKSGLTINQSKAIKGENYIVVNYTRDTRIISVWVVWDARDDFFSKKKGNSNARGLLKGVAAEHIEVLFAAPKTKATDLTAPKQMAKAQLKKQQKEAAS